MTAKVKRYILLNGSKVPVARMAQSDNGIGDWVSAADYDKLVGENEELKSWIKQDGDQHNTCTFPVLKEICNDCRCGREGEKK